MNPNPAPSVTADPLGKSRLTNEQAFATLGVRAGLVRPNTGHSQQPPRGGFFLKRAT